jgi:hypothetical protein
VLAHRIADVTRQWTRVVGERGLPGHHESIGRPDAGGILGHLHVYGSPSSSLAERALDASQIA